MMPLSRRTLLAAAGLSVQHGQIRPAHLLSTRTGMPAEAPAMSAPWTTLGLKGLKLHRLPTREVLDAVAELRIPVPRRSPTFT
jgi:hypothetical protein